MTISNASLYNKKTGQNNLYNIMPISNIQSVINHGLLCYELSRRLSHRSVAMNSVQERRDNIIVDVVGGLRLHQYANLYFTPRNPMMYKLKDIADTLCILVFSLNVLDIDGCVVTDRNAASDFVRFFTPNEGIEHIDFEKVFAKYWNHPDDYFDTIIHKSIKCAEVLIPYKIDFSFVLGAFVLNEESKNELKNAGFEKTILILPHAFYH